MNRGPMSRLVKVPVKCRNCGKIKYNVVCKSNAAEEKREEAKKVDEPTKKETYTEPETTEIKYKKPREYNYVKAVMNRQSQIACSARNKEKMGELER